MVSLIHWAQNVWKSVNPNKCLFTSLSVEMRMLCFHYSGRNVSWQCFETWFLKWKTSITFSHLSTFCRTEVKMVVELLQPSAFLSYTCCHKQEIIPLAFYPFGQETSATESKWRILEKETPTWVYINVHVNVLSNMYSILDKNKKAKVVHITRANVELHQTPIAMVS